jgi:hypothetical protein
MTIRAADDAFRDLALDFRDRRTVANHGAHVGELARKHVIELHDDRVDQSAVDAAVLQQVGFDERPVARAIAGHPAPPPRVVGVAVSVMICARVSAPAKDADRMTSTRSPIAEAEKFITPLTLAMPAHHASMIEHRCADSMAW